MSVIRVDNFGPSAGGTTYSARGIAKAWATYDQSGTIALIQSLNASSITDVSTGYAVVTYTNAFSAQPSVNLLSTAVTSFIGSSDEPATTDTGELRTLDASNNPQDRAYVSTQTWGDLA